MVPRLQGRNPPLRLTRPTLRPWPSPDSWSVRQPLRPGSLATSDHAAVGDNSCRRADGWGPYGPYRCYRRRSHVVTAIASKHNST